MSDHLTLSEQVEQHMENKAIGEEMAKCWDQGHAEGKQECADEIERLRGYFTRIIQVRGGDGMLEGKEALDEMARLAGEALTPPVRNRGTER